MKVKYLFIIVNIWTSNQTELLNAAQIILKISYEVKDSLSVDIYGLTAKTFAIRKYMDYYNHYLIIHSFF